MTTMEDRRAGVLVGMAAGDALGAGYEFGPEIPADRRVRMGDGHRRVFAPGEWTDDTAMAIAIAEAVHSGLELNTDEFEDAVVERWIEWHKDGAKGAGRLTRRVLSQAEEPSAEALRDIALMTFAMNPESCAGNGALMRTAPLALAKTGDWGYVTAAEAISELTHADPISGEACAIWTYAVHYALEHESFDGVAKALELLPAHRVEYWQPLLEEAETRPLNTYTNNGWVVEALQAAWGAIVQSYIDGPEHLPLGLAHAVRGGGDTDTVACIAGALLGARWGASAVPEEWRTMLHGWPGYTVEELTHLAQTH